MSTQPVTIQYLGDQTKTRSKSRSPARKPKSNVPVAKTTKLSRTFASEGVKDHDIFSLPSSDWQLLALITFLGSFVRLFRIYQPTSVVFDEVHFGGFASKYIKGRFFMDVHPPLAKLLITLAGWLAGFNGDFDFKDIGKDYLEPNVPYVAMRMLPAVMGIMTIPTMFLTLKATGCRTVTAALGAGLLIFENGLITQSRLILLDSPLVIFTALTALSWTCFTNQHEQGPAKAFRPLWWFWLAATGIALGATVSVKWVGLFTIAWVGSLTLLQLWVLLGDTKTVTPRLWFKHFFARVFCLIVIPLTFYMAMFGIHFLCLVNPGEGDGFMSSEFQATLNSKGMQDVPVDVAFGSRVSLRHHNTQGGYLHSHNHMYPTGSKQQQITLYPHKDENNVWILENQTIPEHEPKLEGPKAWDFLNVTKIKNGDVLRLYHITTHRRLHSHDQRPPVTEADWQQEVTAYGYEGFEGDANDFFRVEIIKSMSNGLGKEYLRTIQTKFKLVHLMTGCVLFSHKVKLPDWGFEQQEVTCAKGGTLPNSVWYIEQNEHPMIGENAEKVNYRKLGFFGKFWELQQVMWKTNAGLVESHAWDSRPPSWPILSRGINFWGKDHRQIYLIGNPIIWWSSTIAILLYAAVKALAVIRWQRGCNDYSIVPFKRFDYEVGTSVLGWFFHYFPFFLMARQLFLHHYFPALYFAIIALCQTYDFLFSRFSLGPLRQPVVGQTAAVAFLAVSIFVFTQYAPLAYGGEWTKSECNKAKIFGTWDWDCNTFLESYEAYASMRSTPASNIPASAVPAGNQVGEPEKKAQVTPESDNPPPPPPPPPPQQAPQAGVERVINREEKVEFRDENGRLLGPEEVEKLKDKVIFQTRYETRTRIIDAAGNEVYEEPVDGAPQQVAPPHPDVEGPNPSTGNAPSESDASKQPPVAEVGSIKDEQSIIEEEKKPKPGSEGNEATGSSN
ncbi:hypothetical protein BLS_005516 [Venturia inaequalis]|uniref:Dolichyl-phosphate-mannose--protein mannosyltransferase n=1 Tax=Venturia inaequalis TaxID=5025 RepID=A0A8H3V0W8_VENIN|nr:hypothetical protein BLS_005516 [Venturia inaequalis]KAE9980101.1 hypothetical protein EG328_000466 [Venturia inaequalis]RDI89594.1 hypothetical protein Vi05172_g248 [Venturia inaequalis]